MGEPWLAGGAAYRVGSQGHAELRCPPLPQGNQPWGVPEVPVLVWWLLSLLRFHFLFSKSSLKDKTCLRKLGFGIASLCSDLACCSGPDPRYSPFPPTLTLSATVSHIHTHGHHLAQDTRSSAAPSQKSVSSHVILTLEIDHTQTAGGGLERRGFGLGPLAGLWPRSPGSSS